MGRPSSGTLGQVFGTALSTNTPPTHTHSTDLAGSHVHSGNTGNWAAWRTTLINYSTVPAYTSQFHIVSSLEINPSGDHTHPVVSTSASDVLPYVFLTPCRKN